MNTALPAIMKEEGVADLKDLKVRGKFAMALQNERNGDYETAAIKLDEAVKIEAELNS